MIQHLLRKRKKLEDYLLELKTKKRESESETDGMEESKESKKKIKILRIT